MSPPILLPMPHSPHSAKNLVRRVSGKELRDALGFHSERSFQRAHQEGRVGVKLYPMPSPDRGFYARSDDLARYLAKCHAESSNSKERAP